MKIPLLLAASLLLALVAVAPTASAHKGCYVSFTPSPVGGVVKIVYDFTTSTTGYALCGVAYPIADGACHFLIGNACPA